MNFHDNRHVFYSIALFFVMLMISNSPCSADSGNISICVLDLFHPEKIVVHISKSRSGVAPVFDGQIMGGLLMSEGDTMTVSRSGDAMSVTVNSGDRLIFERTEIEDIKFAPGMSVGAPFEYQLEIPDNITRSYSGSLVIRPGPRAALTPVVGSSLEDYVTRVMYMEAGSGMAPEAMKAFAVIVRSYALSQAPRHKSRGCDFCDTTHCQLYPGNATNLVSRSGGGSELFTRMASAVRDTDGEILIYNGKPVKTFYTPACAGHTATPSMTWGGDDGGLQQVPCPFHESGDYFPWVRSVDKDALRAALSSATQTDFSRDTEITITQHETQGGYVAKVNIDAGENIRSFTGNSFRMMVGREIGWNLILSNSFEIREDGDKYVFTGRGFGHGVGFCLAGATEMASRGNSYMQILNHYFPAARLSGGAE